MRLWALSTGELSATLAGHRGAVTALRFARDGALLASGSRDTDIVVWDVASEAGLFRLRGHRGEVTDLAFLKGGAVSAAGAGAVGGGDGGGHGRNALVSCSKDGTTRVWDLDTQHCSQTVVGGR